MIVIFLICATAVVVIGIEDFTLRVGRGCPPNSIRMTFEDYPALAPDVNETHSFYIQGDFSSYASSVKVLEIKVSTLENATWTYISDESQSKNLSLGVDYEISHRNTYLLYPTSLNISLWLMNLTFLVGDTTAEDEAVTIYFFQNKTLISPLFSKLSSFTWCMIYISPTWTFESIDRFNYYNVSMEIDVGNLVFRKNLSLFFDCVSRFSPVIINTYQIYYPGTRFIPIENCQEPEAQYVEYQYNGQLSTIYIVSNFLDRDVRYPDTKIKFKMINLLPGVNHWSQPSAFWAIHNFTGSLINYDRNSLILFMMSNGFLHEYSVNPTGYLNFPVLDWEMSIEMTSSELRANALTNLTFSFNTCVPLILSWHINVTFPHSIDAMEYLFGNESQLIGGENVIMQPHSSLQNYTKGGKWYNRTNNTLGLLILFPNVSCQPDFPYDNNTMVPSINFDTTERMAFDKPKGPIFATFSFTLLNVRNPNFVGSTPDTFQLSYFYPYVLFLDSPFTFYHPLHDLFNTSHLHLSTIKTVISHEDAEVIPLHDLMFEEQEVTIRMKSSLPLRMNSSFLYTLPEGLSINSEKFVVEAIEGFLGTPTNWTYSAENRTILMSNPLGKNATSDEVLTIKVAGIILTHPLNYFDLAVYGTTDLNMQPVAGIENLTHQNALVSLAGICSPEAQSSVNTTMEKTDLWLTFCFDHTLPIVEQGFFTITLEANETDSVAIDPEDIAVSINEEDFSEISVLNSKTVRVGYGNDSAKVFQKNEAISIVLKNLRNPRSVKPLGLGLGIEYGDAEKARVLANGSFIIPMKFSPKSFVSELTAISLAPDMLNSNSFLNLSFLSQVLALKNDIFTLEIPSFLSKSPSLSPGIECMILNSKADCEFSSDLEVNLVFPRPKLNVSDAISMSLGLFQTPSRITDNGSDQGYIKFRGVSSENYAMFEGSLQVKMPLLRAFVLRSADYSRENTKIGGLSNLSVAFRTPMWLEEGIFLNFTVNGSFEEASLIQSRVIFQDLEGGYQESFNLSMRDHQAAISLPKNLSTNSTITLILSNVTNPSSLLQNRLTSIDFTVYQRVPLTEIIVFRGNYINEWSCDQNCEVCAGTSSNCSLCQSGFFFFGGECVNPCPSSYRPNKTIGSCEFYNETKVLNSSEPGNSSSIEGNFTHNKSNGPAIIASLQNSTNLSNTSSNLSNNSNNQSIPEPVTANKTTVLSPQIITSTTPFYPGNIAFINSSFDSQFFLTYYIVITALYTCVYALFGKRDQDPSAKVQMTKCFMFFWATLEVFCLFLMVIKLLILGEFIFMGLFIGLLILTYFHHLVCVGKVWSILSTDEALNWASIKGGKSVLAFTWFMFLWNYRAANLLLSKMWKVGRLVREERVIEELSQKLMLFLRTQLILMTLTLALVMAFLGLCSEKFDRVPFFFQEYVVFMALFVLLSIWETLDREEKPSNNAAKYQESNLTTKSKGSRQSISPTISPTSCLPMDREKRLDFANKVEEIIV